MNKEYNNKSIKAWDKEKEVYISQHCGEVATEMKVSLGYDCNVCSLPIHER